MVETVSRTSENPNRAPAASGPPLRAFAMVLISLAILFAGLGFASLGGSDDDPATSAAPDTSTTTATSAAPNGAAAPTSRAAGAPGAATTSTSAPASGAPTSGAPTSGATVSGAATSTASLAGTTATATVRVFNNSDIAGLAAQTAGYLADEGFVVTETGNYSEGLLTQTSVFYGTSPGEQQTAEAVAEALGVTAQPRFEGIRDAAPGVIVIVTSG
ncbi:LytR C-terminal domain-containing protein [Rhodococcus sp. Z13]|uniref:LytR C-terminal domain-containing protein n=1 Tax=Rhodococcus sacchari TaxID=2962047 RepID=A0ACD4DDZ8_9NOCA|nr:LytR C-terminal domain-containing protein [Rhodococcus sp. Z13]UYP18290.1 LytR C-terminal domain-containing protein [Rhodococcus sp. Z13]